MQETVLITGGTGLIGTRLIDSLLLKGYRVRLISRKMESKINVPCFIWDLESKYWEKDAIKEVDYIIHLAGANVAEGRWTNKRKDEILKSRVIGSKLVSEMLIASNGKIKNIVSASAVGYYGLYTGIEVVDESSKPGDDFLANVCEQWEKSIANAKTKVAILRTGVVLSKNGGAVSKMIAPIKWGIGSPLGTGAQLVPWVHIDDLCQMYIYAFENNLEGIYNAVSPQIITNGRLTLELAKSVNRKIIMPNVPSMALKLLLGEMAQMLLMGSNVSSNKIKQAGFKFKYPAVSEALSDIFEGY